MANVTSFMDDLLKPLASGFAKATNKVDSNKPVGFVDALRQAADSRIGLTNTKHSYPTNNKLFEAVGGQYNTRTLQYDKPKWTINGRTGFKKGDEITVGTRPISDWQRAKSLFYDREGDLKYGRVAGAAVGFGGGAIATLNLGYDMIT